MNVMFQQPVGRRHGDRALPQERRAAAALHAMTPARFLVAQIISRLLVVSSVTVLVSPAPTPARFSDAWFYLTLGLVFLAGAIAGQ